jgi:S-adenosylmethionine decarboxylase proenzyme
MKALGRQILVEYYDCDPDILNDVAAIESILLGATRASQASIISHNFHKFSPHGVSGTVVIAESHVAIHTWPEYAYAAVDIFTCGETIDPWVIQEYIKDAFRSKNTSRDRGVHACQVQATQAARPSETSQGAVSIVAGNDRF